jgi:pilus assembly protein CpaD
MTRPLLLLCLASTLTGCAATREMMKDEPVAARSPTTQFSVTLTHSPDEILLAPHASGLSVAQAAAVSDLADRWRDAGDGAITIQTPSGGGAEAYRETEAVQSALTHVGVPEAQIRLVSYQPASGTTGVVPVVVGFTHYEAQGPHCGEEIKDFTKTYKNQPNNNFGCAVTANFAAMLANPADLAGHKPMDAPDANRRETILDKYRKGEASSSAKDTQANGAVSSVVQ